MRTVKPPVKTLLKAKTMNTASTTTLFTIMLEEAIVPLPST
jgi:hypothetical protein